MQAPPASVLGSFCLAAGLAIGRLLWGRRRVHGAAAFDADPRLLEGKHFVCDLPLCRVLLVDDASYPCWLVLVPRVNHVREVIEMSDSQQAALWREVALASHIIQDLYHPFKLNIAAIGNIVSQLHVHVTGRLQTDPAWPGPCYGVSGPPLGLSVPTVVQMLRAAFAARKM